MGDSRTRTLDFRSDPSRHQELLTKLLDDELGVGGNSDIGAVAERESELRMPAASEIGAVWTDRVQVSLTCQVALEDDRSTIR